MVPDIDLGHIDWDSLIHRETIICDLKRGKRACQDLEGAIITIKTLLEAKNASTELIGMSQKKSRVEAVQFAGNLCGIGLSKARSLVGFGENDTSAFNTVRLSKYSDDNFVQQLCGKDTFSSIESAVSSSSSSSSSTSSSSSNTANILSEETDECLGHLLKVFMQSVIDTGIATNSFYSTSSSSHIESTTSHSSSTSSKSSSISESPISSADLAMIIAILLKYISPKHEWEKAITAALFIRTKTQAAEVLDILAKIIPSFPNNSQLSNVINKQLNSQHDNAESITFFRDVHCHFNNLGAYSKTTSRGGQESKLISPIITMIEWYYQKGDRNLQFEEKYSPTVWSCKEKYAGYYLLQDTKLGFHIEANDYDGVSLETPPFSDLLSEYDELVFEYQFELTLLLDIYEMSVTSGNLVQEKIKAEKRSQVFTSSRLSSKTVNKKCDKCEYVLSFPASSPISLCGCGGRLAKVGDNDEGPIASQFQQIHSSSEKKDRRKEKGDNSQLIIRTLSAGSKDTKNVLIVKQQFSDVIENPSEKRLLKSGSMDDALNDYDKIVREVGRPIMVNPNTKAAFAVILAE